MSRYDILTGRMPPPKKPKCKKCNDNGYLETDNKDLPCDECSAGDTALFNVTGILEPLTGAEIKVGPLDLDLSNCKCIG